MLRPLCLVYDMAHEHTQYSLQSGINGLPPNPNFPIYGRASVSTGAVYAYGSNVVVDGSTNFTSNHADVWGGKDVQNALVHDVAGRTWNS